MMVLSPLVLPARSLAGFSFSSWNLLLETPAGDSCWRLLSENPADALYRETHECPLPEFQRVFPTGEDAQIPLTEPFNPYVIYVKTLFCAGALAPPSPTLVISEAECGQRSAWTVALTPRRRMLSRETKDVGVQRTAGGSQPASRQPARFTDQLRVLLAAWLGYSES